jgi:hypothetical protein
MREAKGIESDFANFLWRDTGSVPTTQITVLIESHTFKSSLLLFPKNHIGLPGSPLKAFTGGETGFIPSRRLGPTLQLTDGEGWQNSKGD